MEDYRCVLNLMKKGSWLTNIDLKDAYFHISVDPLYRKFLKFTYEGQLYEFTCLPFGLCVAPRIFTKLLKPVFEKLRGIGHSSVKYIDDLLLLGASESSCKSNTTETVKELATLGFTINVIKSIFHPCRTIKFLTLSAAR
jgi:hypothetical protein